MGPQLPRTGYSGAISGTFQFVSAAPGRNPFLRYANLHFSLFTVQGVSKTLINSKQTTEILETTKIYALKRIRKFALNISQYFFILIA